MQHYDASWEDRGRPGQHDAAPFSRHGLQRQPPHQAIGARCSRRWNNNSGRPCKPSASTNSAVDRDGGPCSSSAHTPREQAYSQGCTASVAPCGGKVFVAILSGSGASRRQVATCTTEDSAFDHGLAKGYEVDTGAEKRHARRGGYDVGDSNVAV